MRWVRSIFVLGVLVVGTLGALAACGGPTATLSPSPSPAAFNFVAADDRGGWPVPVSVGGFSGGLANARAATAAELAAEIARRPMEGAAGGLTLFEGSDRDVLAIWAGSGCDQLVTITRSGDGSVLAIEPRLDAGCGGPWPVYRGAILTFEGPVDVAAITLELR
jgi:hypothetical protein